MPRRIQYLPALYRLFLRLYPSDLRKEYGDEMANTFQQLVQDEYCRHGGRGVTRVSLSAFGEFFTVALPRHLVSEWLLTASLSLIITSSVLGVLVGLMTGHGPVVHGIVMCR